jgi:hypothetical protein
MTTGVRTFSTKNETVADRKFTPIPAGVYEIEIGEPEVELPKDDFDDKGAVKCPSVNYHPTVFGEGLSEKGRPLFGANLYTTLRPGKDGKAMPNRPNQLVALAKGLGTDIEAGVVTVEKTNTNGETVSQDALNAAEIAEALKAFRGERFKAKIKVVKDTYKGEVREKNEIDRIFPRES